VRPSGSDRCRPRSAGTGPSGPGRRPSSCPPARAPAGREESSAGDGSPAPRGAPGAARTWSRSGSAADRPARAPVRRTRRRTDPGPAPRRPGAAHPGRAPRCASAGGRARSRDSLAPGFHRTAGRVVPVASLSSSNRLAVGRESQSQVGAAGFGCDSVVFVLFGSGGSRPCRNVSGSRRRRSAARLSRPARTG